jgi:hypothetical protein
MWWFFWQGEWLEVTNMFDIGGDDTYDPDQATSIVVQLPNGKWAAIQCKSGEIQRRKPN